MLNTVMTTEANPTLELGLEPTSDASDLTPTPTALYRAAAARSSRGMTLIEILVVLAIIGLIMGGVAIVAFNAFDDAKTKTAAKDIGTLAQSVEMYRLQKNKCPKTAQDIKAAGILQKVTKDPWGGDYVIKCPGEHGPVDISSGGKDGDIATEEDNINSWDENIGETPEEES
ncbi:type II secretion system protein GspG [Enhygromyxa salina]|uniref:Type II secretion system protein G n=1 Tax=Enhygromyxa salina TaxID=215803 RepID=A0A2S9YTC7_9BACT|nr:type II secretion system protein GspG [Enhygromyxa salina]PRQ08330.1 Type II secretion system protein G precursor [Enhygromyxa salina]